MGILILQVVFSMKWVFAEKVFRVYIDVVIGLLIPVFALLWLTIHRRLTPKRKED